MRDATPQTIRLQDYTPPAFLISTVALDVDIREGQATVRATLRLARNPAHPDATAPLVLDGRALELVSASIDGRVLAPADYRVEEGHLVLPQVPAQFSLETVVRFDPGRTPSSRACTPPSRGW
jgi:aminopeptidase N